MTFSTIVFVNEKSDSNATPFSFSNPQMTKICQNDNLNNPLIYKIVVSVAVCSLPQANRLTRLSQDIIVNRRGVLLAPGTTKLSPDGRNLVFLIELKCTEICS